MRWKHHGFRDIQPETVARIPIRKRGVPIDVSQQAGRRFRSSPVEPTGTILRFSRKEVSSEPFSHEWLAGGVSGVNRTYSGSYPITSKAVDQATLMSPSYLFTSPINPRTVPSTWKTDIASTPEDYARIARLE